MRKSLAIAAVAASLLTTAAVAANLTDTGTIKTIDKVKHELTLADRKIFVLPATWQGTGFNVGDKVKVTYEMQNGEMTASDIAHQS
jgi:hypothetical protein